MIYLFLYHVISVIFSPVIFGWLVIRKRKGKEDAVRFKERFGYASCLRPEGKLIWMHGASVGECLSMLPLVKKLLEKHSDLHILVTSGTITSAHLMAERLPQRAFHQYVPIDLSKTAHRFIRYWQPDAVLWFESEFWPNLLSVISKAGIPLVLLNGRISDRSFKRWQRALWFIQPIQRLFTLSFGQTDLDVQRLKRLGAREAVCAGNLKYAAGEPVFDAAELERLLKKIGERPCWCAGSTHFNEEEQLADVHLKLKKKYKNLLFVNAPRHPNRANELERMYRQKGLNVARRSKGEEITPQTDVYLADTIGEMGLIYQLASLVFVGGSLIPFGGQNMLEPMRLKRVVFVGPYPFNFKEVIQRALTHRALIQVQDKNELFECLSFYLEHPMQQQEIMDHAFQMASSEMAVLERVYNILSKKIGFLNESTSFLVS